MKAVLIVEDNPSILALTHFVVERDGYAVLDATSAEQAFARFEENDAQLDLLIVDVTLGSSSGIRVGLELWLRRSPKLTQ
jgi:DNA-binding response OmpR family regulator